MSDHANQTTDYGKLWLEPHGVDAYWQGRNSLEGDVCPYFEGTAAAIRWRYGRQDRKNDMSSPDTDQEPRISNFVGKIEP